MKKGEAERVALSQGWLAHQSPAFQAAVLARARPASFAKDELIFDAGDENGGVYGVVQGSVAVFVPGRGDALRLGHVARGGFWFGRWPVITARRRLLTFRAREPTVALHVSFSALNETAGQDRAWARSVESLLDFAIDLALAAVSDLLIPESDRRLAATMARAAGLDEDARLSARPSKPAGLRLTPSELGEVANVSRRIASRILARFETAGWISIDDDQLAIANPKALAAFAAGET
jgi:CRP-like cAMP-binding protein